MVAEVNLPKCGELYVFALFDLNAGTEGVFFIVCMSEYVNVCIFVR